MFLVLLLLMLPSTLLPVLPPLPPLPPLSPLPPTLPFALSLDDASIEPAFLQRSAYLYIHPSTPLPVYTAPTFAHPRVVRDIEVWFTGGYVTPTEHPHWYHLVSQDGFIYYPAFLGDVPSESETDFCNLPPLSLRIEWYAPLSSCAIATYLPTELQPIAHLYAYYAEVYRVNPMLAFAQAYHETGGFTSWWFREHANPAGLYVTGAYRTTPPSDPYWVYSNACSCWLRGASFPTIAAGVEAHVALLARYRGSTLSTVARRWATDPLYEQKWRKMIYRLFSL